MSECTKPVKPPQDAPVEVWLEYEEDYAAYVECMEEKSGGGGAYPGICDDIKHLNEISDTCKTKLTLVTTPPPPYPLTPDTTLSGITTQMVSVAAEAKAQDLATQAGQSEAYRRCQWIDDNTLPASQAGTMANLAGCGT